jgi:hypothetical protein
MSTKRSKVENMSSTLVAHSGGQIVTLADLKQIPAPEALGPRHYPVKHFDLVETTRVELAKVGLEPVKEQYAVSHNAAKLFATWDLVPRENGPVLVPERVKADRGLSFGFRHGNDRSIAIEMVCGNRVFVCDNMMFSGDSIILHRMHTKNVSLHDEVGRGITKMLDGYSNFEANIERLENTKLSDEQAKALLVDAFMKVRVLAPKYLRHVFEWYFRNYEQAPDCAPRTAYGLINAFTRTLRDEVKSPVVKYTATAMVGRFFGLRTDVRDAVIGAEDVIDVEAEEVTA